MHPGTEMRKIMRRAAQKGNQECSVFVKVKSDITAKHPYESWRGYLDIRIVDWLGVRSINRNYEYRGDINNRQDDRIAQRVGIDKEENWARD